MSHHREWALLVLVLAVNIVTACVIRLDSPEIIPDCTRGDLVVRSMNVVATQRFCRAPLDAGTE